MWVVSELTGKIYKNGVAIVIDDRENDFQDYLIAQQNGLVQLVEATPEEIEQQKRDKATQIDLEYTKKISELMMKHNDKFIEGIVNDMPYTIPQDVLNERQRLKDECNQLIRSLGIEDFTYRQSNLKLKK